MNTSTILSSDDFCRRKAYFDLRWEYPSLTPKDILNRAISHGLVTDAKDYAKAASDYAMQVATECTIDTPETDLLSLAEHIAALAEVIVWTVRIGDPFVPAPSKRDWDSGVYLSEREDCLRSVKCVDRFDGMTEMSLRTAWEGQGESSIYGVPMDVVVVEIGALRQGRWTNPWTSAWRHPVAKTLRFRKRDGESFGANWERVFREHDRATCEEWTDAMTDDGVLAESIHILHIEVPDRSEEYVRLSHDKIKRIAATVEVPEIQLSRCFDRMHPCPYRACCPNGKDPGEMGFRARNERR